MGGTFVNQKNLPRRPIPELEVTCGKFLDWVHPLLSKEEFEKTDDIVQAFCSHGGDGPKLQEELVKWSEKNELLNWTEPLWYDIYLDSRKPLPINSNVFYLLEDKPHCADWSQVYTAAALIVSVLKFKALIDQETLEVDMQSGSPLCMNQYRNLFSASRIPHPLKDGFMTSTSSKHIVVSHKGHLFSLEVLDSMGEMKPFKEMEASLKAILGFETDEHNEEMGILTTLPREEWAVARENLMAVSPQNKDHLHQIDSAIFVLCLDDFAPQTPVESSNQFLHGYGRNRWFDKALQFIVTSNNRIGFNLEHTGFDGSVVTKMTKYLVEQLETYKGPLNTGAGLETEPERISFELNEEMKLLVQKRAEQLDEYISEFEVRVLKFNHFGKNLIKTFRVSPDAFVQIAFQLAQYKLFGRCYSSYEAVMARKFLHGRIEVSHCISSESIHFIEHMLSNEVDEETKVASLKKAIEKQVARLGECRNGEGIDSHLFALLKMYHLKGQGLGMESVPDLFTDKGYNILTHSTICTSTTSAYGVELVGYGPVVDDGFAIRYLKNGNSLTFNMVSKADMKEQLDKLVMYIQESLFEMADLMKNHC